MIYVVFPSASESRCAKAVEAWTAMGYKVGVLTDKVGFRVPEEVSIRINVATGYPGYWRSCNWLVTLAYERWDATVVVCAADDMLPDPDKNAAVLAAEFHERFPDGYGIMQPTGHKMGNADANGKYGVERICGSPFIGRAYAEKRGPYHYGYHHFYGDEEVFEVAQAEGVLWQRPDLAHFHDHWMLYGVHAKTHYQRANQQYWPADKRLFEARKVDGFPIKLIEGAETP